MYYYLFPRQTLIQHLAQGCTEPDAVSSNKTRRGDAGTKWALKKRAGNFKRICISNLNLVQALNSPRWNDLYVSLLPSIFDL